MKNKINQYLSKFFFRTDITTTRIFLFCFDFINNYFIRLYRNKIPKINLSLIIINFLLVKALHANCKFYFIFEQIQSKIIFFCIILGFFLFIIFLSIFNIVNLFLKLISLFFNGISMIFLLFIYAKEKITNVSFLFVSKYILIEKYTWTQIEKNEIALNLAKNYGIDIDNYSVEIQKCAIENERPETIRLSIIQLKRNIEDTWLTFFSDWGGYFMGLDRPATILEMGLASGIIILAIILLKICLTRTLEIENVKQDIGQTAIPVGIPTQVSSCTPLVENSIFTLDRFFILSEITKYFLNHNKKLNKMLLKRRFDNFQKLSYEDQVKIASELFCNIIENYFK